MAKRKKLTNKQRMAVYNKFDGHCAYCGCEIDISDMQVDHIKNGGEILRFSVFISVR